jgi:hypothetical protein
VFAQQWDAFQYQGIYVTGFDIIPGGQVTTTVYDDEWNLIWSDYMNYPESDAFFLMAQQDQQNVSWWGTFLSSFIQLSGGPGNKPTCAGQAIRHMADTLNPLTPGVSTATELAAPVAQGVAINRSLAQTTAAIDEYIVQQGLTVPLRSKVVQKAIVAGAEDAVAVGQKANVAVQMFAVDYAAVKSAILTSFEARGGACAAAFPVL